MHQSPSDLDQRMMARCIELSRDAGAAGELPFACLICRDDEIVAEATNRVVRDRDVTRHAEMVALSKAQHALGTKRLSRCTLYTNVEPCAMCSYCIRETRMRKVVYAIRSPIMGGHSRWGLLQDQGMSDAIPEVFGRVPEIRAAVMREEAEAVWRNWRPVIWAIIKFRGCFGGVAAPGEQIETRGRDGFLRRLLLFHR